MPRAGGEEGPRLTAVFQADPENAANVDLAGATWILGIDVGIRNLGLALLAAKAGDLWLAALQHYDAGTDCLDVSHNARLYGRVLPVLRDVLRVARAFGADRARLGIEQQQKQTNDAHMVEVAGLLQGAFCEAHRALFLAWPADDAVRKVQPSAQTSLAMQRRLLPHLPPRGVVDRAAKKARAVGMLKAWLEARGLDDVSALYDALLMRVGARGKLIKSGDRRDHIADALLCAAAVSLLA